MQLGVCYYPEHWPRERWADDARAMVEAGISVVRIGEFAWSRLEPRPGELQFDWLDEAVATLAEAGLSIVMGTPTATPPKWLVDTHPEILAVDEHGRPRGFGSRRHYCFASPVYRTQSERIIRLMAERYAGHPAIIAWQTDNEYGCHDTILSYSPAARAGFGDWLQQRYGDVEALNNAWGSVFWSMEVTEFDQVEAPVGTVTEPHPAIVLDYRRYCSDLVVTYNRLQVDTLRTAGVSVDIVHNFMGLFTEFDHFDVARDLDIASWDSYPLGFLERGAHDEATRDHYRRQGHPDFAGFHHDLYRAMCRGRWWVMEQQPGPVNWAISNAAPLPGMVRLWSHEAFAHGAEVVSYFRWRQAPFAQEQMHAGLLRPDGSESNAWPELLAVRDELPDLARENITTASASVALMFDYSAIWACQIQPHAADFDALELHLSWYSALRRLGLDVDIVSPTTELDGYALVVLPCQVIADDALATRLEAARDSGTPLIIGARSGSRTPDFQIPANLAPGPLATLTGVTVDQIDGMRPGTHPRLSLPGSPQGHALRWREQLDEKRQKARVVHRFEDGMPAVTDHQGVAYLTAWLDEDSMMAIFAEACRAADIATTALPEGVRLRRRGALCFAFNYAPEPRHLPDNLIPSSGYLIGDTTLPPAGVSVWSMMH
ncbi:beta-galactosidase [Kushneria indalinina]|uniref:Beta-galactosidase n=1 Tax=Kushneria indalinina DSM 14324 TaxID=1122140 RepID=A0A3D9DU34_9GAMM|nr:beta-galactosidase [Kushneria indalinina]REC94237.1 beta-galactosidase [Kushneria indalinina DSM 14324]